MELASAADAILGGKSDDEQDHRIRTANIRLATVSPIVILPLL